ncbi:hypothetical protein SARC_06157 [Sphaeroforma arctica JP610]|uniref:Protein TEX261 n=1 Tax=Sphaeroforma arctica JP610 TaxID=667725 RepID=A0A0L0FXG1_9EUKA|nr:hypothetical protein SARC_06157 [Sphaeroforma arctica JP610]KNC81530.1 hypothetical protein SARC_06157 [Sphaeroforma arctica JP610]|eukprot:XP_014155432.1 hypothetical protein SARC_06157 [Sphaeroforma arctica JP610]
MWLFEGYPLLEVVLPGLVAHGFYSLLLPTFPVCNFASVGFVSSTVMFCVHQYCVFSYFSRHYYVFADVLAYFTVCVWLVPFIFFVSLTSNDGNLPTKSSDGQASATPAARRSSKVGLKSMLNFLSWKSDDLPKIHETLNETHSHSSLGMGGDQYHQNNGNMSGYESAGSFQSRSNSPYDNQPGSNGANIGGTNPYHRQHSNHFEPQNTYGNVGSRSYDYSQKHI